MQAYCRECQVIPVDLTLQDTCDACMEEICAYLYARDCEAERRYLEEVALKEESFTSTLTLKNTNSH